MPRQGKSFPGRKVYLAWQSNPILDTVAQHMANRVRLLTVTDLHLVTQLYEQLGRAVTAYRPDALIFVGDFLDCCGFMGEPQLTTAQAAAAVAGLTAAEIVFVRGNHEDTNWREFRNAWKATGKPLKTLHGELGRFAQATLVGFPCTLGNEIPFSEDKPELPLDADIWLSALQNKVGPLMRTLWVMHEPPRGTRLSEPNSVVAGCSEWTRAIQRFSPLATISGHDHETPRITKKWHDRIGDTLCVNVGQSPNAPLHYTIVDAEFPSAEPSLPSRLTVTAYPWNESVQVL
jgi:Icc-related predicted phosphoesterase